MLQNNGSSVSLWLLFGQDGVGGSLDWLLLQ